MDALLGFVAGALTLLNPCVLPVLPIVLAASLQADRRGPVFLTLGLSASFIAVGLGLSWLGPALGVAQEDIEPVAALLMVAFGLTMLLPSLGTRLAGATAGLSARANAGFDRIDQSGPWGMALGGALLGLVWSPCIGPTLGSAIALAASGANLGQAALTMIAFAAGVSTIMLALAYGAREALMRRQALMRRIALRAKPAMGITFVVVGLGIAFGVHRWLEFWAVETLPAWFNDLSILI